MDYNRITYHEYVNKDGYIDDLNKIVISWEYEGAEVEIILK